MSTCSAKGEIVVSPANTVRRYSVTLSQWDYERLMSEGMDVYLQPARKMPEQLANVRLRMLIDRGLEHGQ
ncbi:MAG: hypothetical protein OXG44_15090 [Gammaproteobacteria bacterium]|nr:hypothetical protein [Gammaproteobacteria bacterium]